MRYPLTFILGTGRCGSTMMSRLLTRHENVLSLSEFFTSLGQPIGPPAGAAGPLDGPAFWRLLATPNPRSNFLMKKGAPGPDVSYRQVGGRFPIGEVPAISMVTLASLPGDPDALFDRLAAEVPTWPADTPAAQYRRLFEWLCAQLGRSVVVERSGGSVQLVPRLRQWFPEARYVHLYRNGPDCALSMSRHLGFRFAPILHRLRRHLGEDPYTDPYAEPAAATLAKLPAELRPFLPHALEVEAIRQFRIPLAEFGKIWSIQTTAAVPELAKLPAGSLLNLSYDRLLGDPERELRAFAEFSALPDAEAWARKVAQDVDPSRHGGTASLPADARAVLERACEPGMDALRTLPGVDLPEDYRRFSE